MPRISANCRFSQSLMLGGWQGQWERQRWWKCVSVTATSTDRLSINSCWIGHTHSKQMLGCIRIYFLMVPGTTGHDCIIYCPYIVF